MAIRFQCPSCKGKLKVGDHKAGAKKSCPLCGYELTIPDASPHSGSASPSPDESSESDSYLDALVVDASQIRVDRATTPRGPHRADAPLTLSRRVVYATGGLLIVVAAFFFVFGVLVGRITVQRSTSATRQPTLNITRTVVTGTVHRRENNQREPDVGSVVILVPRGLTPETLVDGSKLHPDNFTGTAQPEAQLLRTFGGDVVQVDGQGRFRTTLDANKNYDVLVISKNVERAQGVDRSLRATWGELFVPIEPLVGDRATKTLALETRGASTAVEAIVMN